MIQKILIIMGIGMMIGYYASNSAGQVKKLPERSEIDSKYKWKLEDIYSSNDLWESDFKKVHFIEFKNFLSQIYVPLERSHILMHSSD